MRSWLLAVLWSWATVAGAGQFQVGVARQDITPTEPVWMGGYAVRKHASTGVAQPIWAKALAVRDAAGHRAVIVTLDLLRIPWTVPERLVSETQRRYGLERSQILFNCAHNHSGPSPWEGDPFTALTADEYDRCRRYTERLIGQIVDLVGAALGDLSPAEIRYSVGEATFAANRRVRTPKGFDIAYNPEGPVDHRVPVFAFTAPDGRLRAVLFGYACHNTTIDGSSYQIAGDYAGFAQADLERRHPGATALFLQLCAGDQDPYPRGTLELASRHGSSLAAAVDRALEGSRPRVDGSISTAFVTADVALAPHTREQFARLVNDPSAAVARNARAMLQAYDEGRAPVSVPFPVHAVRFGNGPTLVALGGEPVIDYALRARREFPGVVLAGYSNRVVSYVPSRRVLAEGGYEAGDSAIYYRLPGPYTAEVEDTIFAAIRDVVERVGGKR